MRRFVYVTYGLLAAAVLGGFDQPAWVRWSAGIAFTFAIRTIIVRLEMEAMSEGARLARRFDLDPGFEVSQLPNADGADG